MQQHPSSWYDHTSYITVDKRGSFGEALAKWYKTLLSFRVQVGGKQSNLCDQEFQINIWVQNILSNVQIRCAFDSYEYRAQCYISTRGYLTMRYWCRIRSHRNYHLSTLTAFLIGPPISEKKAVTVAPLESTPALLHCISLIMSSSLQPRLSYPSNMRCSVRSVSDPLFFFFFFLSV